MVSVSSWVSSKAVLNGVLNLIENNETMAIGCARDCYILRQISSAELTFRTEIPCHIAASLYLKRLLKPPQRVLFSSGQQSLQYSLLFKATKSAKI